MDQNMYLAKILKELDSSCSLSYLSGKIKSQELILRNCKYIEAASKKQHCEKRESQYHVCRNYMHVE